MIGYDSLSRVVFLVLFFLPGFCVLPSLSIAKGQPDIVEATVATVALGQAASVSETAVDNQQLTGEPCEPAAEQTLEKEIEKLIGSIESKSVSYSVAYPLLGEKQIQLSFTQLQPPGTYGRLTIKQNQKVLFTEHLDITSKTQKQALLEKLEQRNLYVAVAAEDVKKAVDQLADLLRPQLDITDSRIVLENDKENLDADTNATELKPDLNGIDEQQKPLVTNMFYDTSIRQAFTDIATQTGVIIVPDMSVQGIVTCELKDVPLEKALEIVAATGGYVVKKMDGYYLIGSPSSKAPNFQTLGIADVVISTLKFNYLKAEDAKGLLPEPYTDYIQANKNRNEICVTAPRGIAEKILSNLRDADKPPRQIMLDAKIVELTSDAKEQLGIDWQWEWQHPSPGDNTRTGTAAFDMTENAIELGYATTAEFTKSLSLTLALLCQNDSATIVANPRVTAMDGKKAEIKVTTEEYFKITTGPATYAYATIQTIESGITLEMTPRIGTGDEITLEVSPEVSDVVGVGSEGLPKITRRKATTTVRVKNGGTVVIGGMVNNTVHNMVSKVPLLGDVPILGYLFKSTEEEKSTRDILIFITPHFLPDNADLETNMATLKERPVYEQVEPAGEKFREQLHELLSLN